MRILLAPSLLLAASAAGAQAHGAGHAREHDHAAASGSGQAIFDAAVTHASPASEDAAAPTNATIPQSHEGHAGDTGIPPHVHDQHAPPSGAHRHPSPVGPTTHGSGTNAHHAGADAPLVAPIPVPSDADRAAAFPQLHSGHAHGSPLNSLVRFNRFEAWDAQPGSGQAWEASAWFGGDVQRLWLRSEGEREHGRTATADLEVLYGRGISPWWDLVAGVRHDFAPGPSRNWAALGVQGMAPYKFEVSATAYLGERGRSAFVAEVEYELLLTNRLVLQPLLEFELRGQDDPASGTGSGLSSAEAGLRLRYEITRRFAPYVGLVHERTFGGTADYRREEGDAVRDTRWVAGVRWWF